MPAARRVAAAQVALVAALLLWLGGCGGAAPPPTGAPPLADEELLVGSWIAAVVANPGALSQLLDAPGGEGWLALFAGDHAEALRHFGTEASPSARLGRARIHLANASMLQAAQELESQVAQAWFLYRAEHRADLRVGPMEGLLSLRLGVDPGEGFKAGGSAESPRAVALRTLLKDPAAEVAGLGQPWASRLSFIRAMAARPTSVPATLPEGLALGTPDHRDDLGEDAEAGLRFTLDFYDPGLPGALGEHHRARAAAELVGLRKWAAALGVELGAEPDGVKSETPGDAEAWLALFAGPQLVPVSAPSVARRPPEPLDSLLAGKGSRRDARAAWLRAHAQGEGADLVGELGLLDRLEDWTLRAAAARAFSSSDPVGALRLAERSLDSGGGDSRSWVTGRNDRRFLMDLVAYRWAAGQTGGALEVLHGLALEQPALQSVQHYLGQLDAASSVRQQGKASQR